MSHPSKSFLRQHGGPEGPSITRETYLSSIEAQRSVIRFYERPHVTEYRNGALRELTEGECHAKIAAARKQIEMLTETMHHLFDIEDTGFSGDNLRRTLKGG